MLDACNLPISNPLLHILNTHKKPTEKEKMCSLLIFNSHTNGKALEKNYSISDYTLYKKSRTTNQKHNAIFLWRLWLSYFCLVVIWAKEKPLSLHLLHMTLVLYSSLYKLHCNAFLPVQHIEPNHGRKKSQQTNKLSLSLSLLSRHVLFPA